MRSILDKKRGDISIETVLISILTIMGMGFLIFLGVKLYNFFISQDEKNAQAFLDGLNEKIKNLEDGQTGNFPLRGLNDWVLVGWSSRAPGKPEKCFFGSCICIVEEGKSVQEDGFCRKTDRENIIINSSLTYLSLVGTSSGVAYDVLHRLDGECILLENQLSEFKVYKSDSDIWITTGYYFESFKEKLNEREQDIQKQKRDAVNVILNNCKHKPPKQIQNTEEGILNSYPYQGGGSPI